MVAARSEPTSSGDTTSTDTDLSEDELFELLANSRRRHILHLLMHDDDPIEIGPLSREIAAWEDGHSIEDVSSDDRKRVYTALQQSHLPRMDRAGVVSFDPDRGTIESTPALDEVEIYMDVVRGNDIPWSHYYLGLTVLAGALLAISQVGIVPGFRLPALAWQSFVLVAFGVSAIAHWLHARRHRLGIDGDPPIDRGDDV